MAQTAEFARVEQGAFFRHCGGADVRLAAVLVQHDRRNRQIVFGGELPVALVVRRNRHNGAGAVLHQHEVGDPDWHFVAGQRMDGEQTGCHAFFLHRRHLCFGDFGVAAFGDKVSQHRVAHRRLQRQRMASGDRDVGSAQEGVRTRGVNGHFLFAVGNVEGDLDPFGTANPVALHGFDLFWPVFQRVEVVKQLIGIVGDLNEPLRDLFALDFGVAAPAAAVDNLFVRQHRLIVRAPVHRRGFFINQAFFIQFGEEPLFPAVVFRLAGGQLAAPVIAEAQQFQLVLHIFDVVVGPWRGRGVVFYRRAFRRQAERVPADRLQHVFAEHTLVTGDHVANGVVTHVAHM